MLIQKSLSVLSYSKVSILRIALIIFFTIGVHNTFTEFNKPTKSLLQELTINISTVGETNESEAKATDSKQCRRKTVLGKFKGQS